MNPKVVKKLMVWMKVSDGGDEDEYVIDVDDSEEDYQTIEQKNNQGLIHNVSSMTS